MNAVITHDACALCDGPLPANPIRGRAVNETDLFCCHGCYHVHNLLRENGIEKTRFKESELYKISDKLGILQNRSSSDGPGAGGGKGAHSAEIVVHLDGIWCYSCTWIIEKVLNEQKGVFSARVSFSTDTATIVYNPLELSADDITSTIRRLGYGATRRDRLLEKQAGDRKSLLMKMGISLFLMKNIMFFSYVIYIGFFQALQAEISHAIPYILLILSTPSVFWCGSAIHTKAFWSLKNRNLSMELLLSISIFSSYFFSIYSLIMGSDHLYFDTSAGLVALLLIGKFIETSAKQKAMENINKLYMMLPGKARLKTPEGSSMVSVNLLKSGDVVIVKGGEKIPADGIIVRGETAIDESMLTGESVPVPKKEGDKIFGSTINYDGSIEARVIGTGSDSVISRIIKLVENAMLKKTKIEEIADQFTRYFIPLVLAISIATFLYLLIGTGLIENALARAITVLVVACPCALGIATPLAVLFGIERSSKEGVLIRDGSVLQHLGDIDTVVFDKTGTITEGKLNVEGIYGDMIDDETIRIIGSLERHSNHPIGKAIVRFCGEKGLQLYDARDIRTSPGMGLKGTVDTGGEDDASYVVVLGNEKFMEPAGGFPGDSLKRQAEIEAEKGNTTVYFRISGKSSGYISFNDTIKKGIRTVVENLEKTGVAVLLLSGDSEMTTSKIAGKAGIKMYKAGSVPGEKLVEIAALQKAGKYVAMVGDGINDAPAIAQADVGIAMGSGTEIAIESSDVVMLRDEISLIPFVITMSKYTIKVIKQNLLWAFLYNSLGIFLAVSGVLNPLIAAFAMVISSATVIGNSMRLRKRGPVAAPGIH